MFHKAWLRVPISLQGRTVCSPNFHPDRNLACTVSNWIINFPDKCCDCCQDFYVGAVVYRSSSSLPYFL